MLSAAWVCPAGAVNDGDLFPDMLRTYCLLQDTERYAPMLRDPAKLDRALKLADGKLAECLRQHRPASKGLCDSAFAAPRTSPPSVLDLYMPAHPDETLQFMHFGKCGLPGPPEP
ncbi:hypothetical protein BH10PSE17_BH10PSE17_27580 [soil metagenome]